MSIFNMSCLSSHSYIVWFTDFLHHVFDFRHHFRELLSFLFWDKVGQPNVQEVDNLDSKALCRRHCHRLYGNAIALLHYLSI